jgi:hypothetical protein
MKDNLLNRVITALNNAGIQVIGFKGSKYGTLKLKVISNGPEPGELGYKGEAAPQRSPEFSIVKRSVGETCDLVRYLGASDWRHAINLTQEVIRAGKATALNVGDFVHVKFDVPAANYDGVDFPALHVDEKVQIINANDDKVIFNFADIIFLSAINANDKNEGGFSQSALAKYLNNEFLAAMDISDVLLANHDELDISLLTAFELFGDEEYWVARSNYFDEPHQIEFCKNERNRVKSWKNETHWYWTSSARASSAALFCYCNNSGGSYDGNASSVGGVAPAFCVA